ncbi:MAG TPA: GspH/FimT family pseudopilin [Candidatus Saccharimonadales bacterium]|nr:GspH/FimT family pseudopilin [Candidatus Saccharimonadales bacterium]
MQPPLPVNPKFRAGFTLIELMVVVVLIAIMSVMILGEMTGTFQDALLRSSSRQLISVFNLASSRAISVNRQHRVRLDRATGRYLVEKRERGNEFVPLKDVAGGEGTLDSRISIHVEEPGETESSSDTVSFFADGTADSREVELRDRAGFGLALRVSPITSRVQIIELERQ